MEFINIYTSFV